MNIIENPWVRKMLIMTEKGKFAEVFFAPADHDVVSISVKKLKKEMAFEMPERKSCTPIQN